MGILGEPSGVRLVGFYLDKILDEFVEDGGDVVESVEALEEPAAEGALEAREGVTAVDEVARADVARTSSSFQQ
jgi:hypothetical protein